MKRRLEKRWIGWGAALVCVAALLVAGILLAFAQRRESSAPQERSRPATGSGLASINVKAGGDFQAALDRARPGDTITLEAGATFRGAFKLPNKPGAADFITIRSSVPDAQLPAPDERLDPSRYAAALPKIVSGTAGAPAIETAPGAHHYRFVGVEFGPTPKGEGNIILLGTGEEKSPDELPHDIEFDRTYVHGDPSEGQRRGIAANGRAIRILNSYFSDIKRKSEESQAICGWGGDGPFEIVNNYIEAAAEGVLFGGATPRMRIVPSDILVRGNHFNKPLRWRAEGWLVKNHFELKNARRVVVDGNLLTNDWTSGQDGTAVLFTVRDEDKRAPQATVEDIQFINNTVRGAAGALNLYGSEGQGGHRLTVRNNLFDDISGSKWGGGDGQFMTVTQWDGLVVVHNTILMTGNITKAYGEPVTGFVFRDNIVPQNAYGFIGSNHAPGADSLNFYFPGAVVSHNAIVGGDARDYKAPNIFPASLKQLKFINPEGGDYRVRPDSPLKNAASDGTDIGANLAGLAQADR
ncbi:MAG TPA: hypothetical protein VHU19_07280 [Pyrinomonadaceae bacterium]|jgi:hypothetical protein|nr:hypothetical protein [Pyrinomonadaceae bacterium]